jgi:hypothetical protein
MKSHTYKVISSTLLATALVFGGLTSASADGGTGRQAQVLPPHSHPYGKSYSEWSAKWWQWLLEHPIAGHPGANSPDFDVRSGQKGKVWFLASPAGETITRSVTIPTGKALFIALLNAEASNLEDPPFFGDTEETQREAAEWFADHIVSVSCSVDGKPVRHIERFRVQSPQFCFTAPTPWIFGATGGEGTAVGDGYYVMLAPLSKGSHTVHTEGLFRFSEDAGDPFTADIPLDVTYHINVTPGNDHDGDGDGNCDKD